MKPWQVQNLIEGLPVAVVILIACWLLSEGIVGLARRPRRHWLWPVVAYFGFGLAAVTTDWLCDRTHPGPVRIAFVLTTYGGYTLSLPYLVARLCGPGSGMAKCPLWVQIALVLLAFAAPHLVAIVTQPTLETLYSNGQWWDATLIGVILAVAVPPALLGIFLWARTAGLLSRAQR